MKNYWEAGLTLPGGALVYLTASLRVYKNISTGDISTETKIVKGRFKLGTD